MLRLRTRKQHRKFQTEPKGYLNQRSSELLYFANEFMPPILLLIALPVHKIGDSTMLGATMRSQFLPFSRSPSTDEVLCPPIPSCQVFLFGRIVLNAWTLDIDEANPL